MRKWFAKWPWNWGLDEWAIAAVPVLLISLLITAVDHEREVSRNATLPAPVQEALRAPSACSAPETTQNSQEALESSPEPLVQASDRSRGELLDAIAQVESHGDDQAVNQREGALGRYQIRAAYWQDGCEYARVNWPHSDAHDPRLAEAIMAAYWLRYGATTNEERARMHNGGPDGAEQDCTLGYWRRVQEVMK